MATFFDTMKKSYVDVPVDAAHDNAIETGSFLEASESLCSLFGTPPMELSLNCSSSANRATDLLGSVAFTPVKNDIMGNIKVRSSLEAPQ